MSDDERTVQLEQFRGGYAAVVDALEGISEEELDQRPAPEEWSPREVVHHLADSEAMAYTRLRRVLADDDPLIQAYDEPGWARRLHYERPIGASLAVLAAVRTASLELLERLTPEEWERTGTHEESGVYGVRRWLRIYAKHSHDHADQIRRARRGEI